MTFFGKPIPTDKINFVMNCISFVLGIIFFIRMQMKMNEEPDKAFYNTERDSLLVIESRIHNEVAAIKLLQDSIVKTIQKNKSVLTKQNKVVAEKRDQIISTINGEWENLPPQDQNDYLSKLLLNLKPKDK